MNLLQTAVPGLPEEHHRKAHSYTGLAYHFSERWAEALGYFMPAARGQRGSARPDALETSSFLQKKLVFARALRDAGACDARGLDLLERQLMGFFTNYRITDASYRGIRKVPAFEDVLGTTRDYYRAMGKTEAEWLAHSALGTRNSELGTFVAHRSPSTPAPRPPPSPASRR